MYLRQQLRVLFAVTMLLQASSASSGAGQEPRAPLSAQVSEGSVPPEETGVRDTDYRVGPGDRLALSVAGVPDIGAEARVSNSGKIHLPHLGIIAVDGLTVAGLEATISGQLLERGLVKDPWVTVRVVEHRAQPVYILGEVQAPGQFTIKKEMHLIDLITMAWGFNEVASPVGYLYRRKPDAGSLPPGEVPVDEAIAIDFDALNEGSKPDLNLRLRGGDVLYVPQRQTEHFYLIGDVNSPGSFPLEARMPVSQALAIGGGTMRTAKLSKAMVVRFSADGGREELPLDLEAVLKGSKPDLLVQANDILYVPGSTMKTFTQALMGIVPTTITQSMNRGMNQVRR